MAERRMFAKTIIDSDAFLDLPMMSQLLYFHLSMRADDDGFINKPRAIMRLIGAKDDDMKALLEHKFIILFESGVVVIKHWRIHNYIQRDRYTETKYKFERSTLYLDENKAYSEHPQEPVSTTDTECIQDVSSMDTQYVDTQDRLEIGKSKDIDSIGKSIDRLEIEDCKGEETDSSTHQVDYAALIKTALRAGYTSVANIYYQQAKQRGIDIDVNAIKAEVLGGG